VFTTVHANNVFDVIGRFMHMGVDPYNLVAALNGVVAQRLLRINCPACSADMRRMPPPWPPPGWRGRWPTSASAPAAAAASAGARATGGAGRSPKCCCWTTSCAT
jgi:general secretion pathway protein E